MENSFIRNIPIFQNCNCNKKDTSPTDTSLPYKRTKLTAQPQASYAALPFKKPGLVLAMLAALFVASCSTPAAKVENAKENVTQAKQELKLSQQEYANELALFRAETERELNAFEKEILAINAKIKTSNSKLKAEYEKQIAVLDAQNKEMRKNLSEYKSGKKEDWTKFKADFYGDMNSLGQSLKNFTVDNK
jgi:uncharacterized protein HemX